MMAFDKVKKIELICGICKKKIDVLDSDKVPIQGAEDGRNYAHQDCFKKLKEEYEKKNDLT